MQNTLKWQDTIFNYISQLIMVPIPSKLVESKTNNDYKICYCMKGNGNLGLNIANFK